MDFSRILLLNEDMLLADGEHVGDIAFGNDMSPFERNTLETLIHFGDIVAQRQADGIQNFNLFYVFLYLFQNGDKAHLYSSAADHVQSVDGGAV